MALSQLKSFAILALVISFLSTTEAVRQFNKRSDLDNVQPISQSGYTVPLESGASCQNAANCTTALPAPDSGKVLTVLTLARGNMTYSCTDSPSELPSYVSQQTELYDVAPLIQLFPSEETLHNLVPQFLSYDYSELTNSTLQCIGDIYTQDGETSVTLTGYEPFTIHVNVDIMAANSGLETYWAQSVSADGTWEVYRVETAGGAVPANCGGQSSTFDITYAAEYWFYH